MSARPLRRQTLALAAILALLAGVGAGAVLLAAARGSEHPPANGAARIVPADALLYLHLSTDPARPAVQRATALAGRIPDVARLRDGLLGGLTAGGRGTPLSYAREIRPWLGREAALAFVDSGTGRAVPLLVLDVADRTGAERFLARRAAGATGAGKYRGVALLRFRTVAIGFVAHALVAGPEPAVHAAIDASAGRRAALAGDSVYTRASAGAPAGRVADLYVSQAGVRQVLIPRRGALGAVASLLDAPGLLGTGLAVSAAADGASVRVHSALDARVVEAVGAPPSFVPRLTGALPANALALLDVHGLDRAGARFALAASAGGLAGGAGELARGFEPALREAGIDLRRDVLPLVSNEVAVAVTGSSPVPLLTLVAPTRDPVRASAVLAQIQAPLAQVLARAAGAGGEVPVLDEASVGGVAVHQLRVGPAFELDYAVFGGRLVISTGLKGIEAVVRPGPRLAGDARFRTVLGDDSAPVTSVLFLDLRKLLGLGERIGLTERRRSGGLRAVLGRIRGVGLRATGGVAESTAELRLQIP